jgi:hypothetical protein
MAIDELAFCWCGTVFDGNGRCLEGHVREPYVTVTEAPLDPVSEGPPATIRASEVMAEKVAWLWPGRVPLAMPTVLGGFPGVGKSTILYDLAARTSREGKNVLILTAEDHLSAVVRPRLEAAEADLDLVHLMVDPITLPDDVGVLGNKVRELDAALVTVDPLVAFIGDSVNSHRDHHVRRVLAPLADLAESTGAAVTLVIHTNKGSDSEPLMRISGSVGFTGAARSVLLAADDPNDEGRRILAVAKSNLAEFPPPLAYHLVGVELAHEIITSKVEWLGEAPEVDVRELLGRREPEERTQVDEAVDYLRQVGVLDAAQPAKDLEREAESIGIHEKALQRARRRLNVPVWKDGFPGVWMWGPKWTPDLDTTTPVQMSSSARPAETPLPAPDLDTGNGVGEPDPQTFISDWNRAARERALEKPPWPGWPSLGVTLDA